jgi:hypothetical protein
MARQKRRGDQRDAGKREPDPESSSPHHVICRVSTPSPGVQRTRSSMLGHFRTENLHALFLKIAAACSLDFAPSLRFA